MPEIYYYYNGEKKRYYPDIFIPSMNLIIETKSLYTFKAGKELNDLKFKATKSLGFIFQLDVWTEKQFKSYNINKI